MNEWKGQISERHIPDYLNKEKERSFEAFKTVMFQVEVFCIVMPQNYTVLQTRRSRLEGKITFL
jgi:hypothetical protein